MKGSKSGGFMGKAGGVVGVGLQVAALGKDMAETSFQNTAANAGLGSPAQGGRHVVTPPRNSSESPPPTPGPASAREPMNPAEPAPQETPPPPRPPDSAPRGSSAASPPTSTDGS